MLPKTCNFTICSIFSNSGHVGWCTASPDTILKLDTLVMIQTKFGFHWSSTLEDFWKSLRQTTDNDDGRQVMAIAHWVRWAKNCIFINEHQNTLNLVWWWRFHWANNINTDKIKTRLLCHSQCPPPIYIDLCINYFH